MIDVQLSVRPRFIAAGWQPGRRVPISPSLPIDHPAAKILVEFGGLNVEPVNRDQGGEECGRVDMNFYELFPDESISRVWADLLCTRLIGIAEVCHGHGELYVATDGRIFGRSCVHDAFWYVSDSFSDAVERLLLGRRSRPMLRPDQSSVRHYGIIFTHESTEIYRYKSL